MDDLGSSPTRRILFVDDDPQVCRVFARIVEREGFEVDVASGGAQALALTQNTKYAVVATDLRMPGMDGHELLSRLRVSCPDTTLMVVSASGEDLTHRHSEPVVDVIPKPWHTDQLVHALRRAVDLHRVRSKTRAQQPNVNRGELRVLVVEDNRGDAELVMEFARSMGEGQCSVEHCSLLKDALGALERQRFSVVLTDLGLPDAQGLSAVRQLLIAAPTTPLIVLSGIAQETTALAAVEAGAMDYLVKDRLNRATLWRALRYALDRHHRMLQYKNLLALSPDGMVVADLVGKILFANPPAARLLERDADALKGMQLDSLPTAFSNGQEITLPSGVCVEVRSADGEWNGVAAQVISLHDITATKAAQEQLNHVAHHDQLTGLGNRLLFSQELRKALAHANRSDRAFALYVINVDQFKDINDTLGHEAGDAVLVEVATRLYTTLRKTDFVGRLGGDEFVVLAEELADDGAANALGRKLVSVLEAPFFWEGKQLCLGSSIGIALCPQDAATAEDLLQRADLAMSQAKRSGGCQYQFADPQLHTRVMERMALESELRGAVADRSFALHYQPQVSPDGVIAVEVLLRWNHPRRGMLAAGAFVPALERTGLIVAVGEWILRKAIAELAAALRPQSGVPLRLAVNVSAIELERDGFVERVAATLEEADFPPSCLELEVTETTMVHRPELSRESLRRLKALGVRIALDDFGTGYSSLSSLREFPELDCLKIDRSFVQDIRCGGRIASMVAALVTFGHSLGLDVVAEGVEDAEQLSFLRRAGCRVFQGYYFARPAPADQLAELAKQLRSVAARELGEPTTAG